MTIHEINFSSRSTSRRGFLTVSAGMIPATVAAKNSTLPKRVLGANDRIRLGILGCGDRGINAHMKGIYTHVKETNFEIVAVCDPWRVAREAANDLVRTWFGRDARQFVSYRDLLALKDLDAVMIASCDHQHTTHLEAAARAGKHIYIEKPMAREMEPLVRAYDAVKAAGVIVQVGTQIRSLPEIVGCRELFQTGAFGRISRVEECRNAEQPYWYRYLKPVRREDVDWKEFLMDAPPRPFHPDLYSGWYGYYDFSKGPIPGFGSHFLDLVHYITGAQFPTSCVCLGGTFTWKDEHRFTAPDCIQATWVYPEGFLVSSSNNLGNGFGNTRKLFGDQGVLELDNWSAPVYHAKGAPNRLKGSIRGNQEIRPVSHPDHFLNWLQCLRSGKQPHAPIEAGFQHSVAIIMAMKSYETGRRTVYDPLKRKIKTV